MSHSQQQAQARYPRGRDQNEYKFTVCWTYYRKTTAHTQISQNKTDFLHWQTLCKLLPKQRDRVATEDKNNIVYGIDCSNSEAVYFGESKRSLRSRSDEHKRSGRNYDCENYEMAKHCWEADQNFS